MTKSGTEADVSQAKLSRRGPSDEYMKGVSGASESAATHDDEGNVHPPKRQRVSRACDQCRAKKDRCDGATPICSTCAFLDRVCSYKAHPKKRGIPTGYIRTIELLLGTLISLCDGAEKTLQELLASDLVVKQLRSILKGTDLPESFLAKWKTSGLLKDIDKLLYALDQAENSSIIRHDSQNDEVSQDPTTITHREEIEAIFRGVSQHLSPVDKETHPSLTVPEAQWPQTLAAGLGSSGLVHINDTTRSGQSDRTTFVSSPHGGSINQKDQLSSSFIFTLPSNVWSLIDVYFSYSHCWLPIVQKHEVLRTAYSYGSNGLHISSKIERSGSHATMWAILALASEQMESLQAKDYIDASDHGPIKQEKLYSIAYSLIPQEYGQLDSDHIVAMLLLSICKLKEEDWRTAWMLIGQAVRLIVLFGWSQGGNYSAEIRKTTNTRDETKRIVMSCFVLETLVSSLVGRHPFLQKHHVMAVGYLEEDGLEEWSPWEKPSGHPMRQGQPATGPLANRLPLRSLSTFNRLFDLYCILSDFSARKGDDGIADDQIQPFRERLVRWRKALPETHSIGSTQSRGILPHILNLHLTFDYISLLVASQGSGQQPKLASEYYSKHILELSDGYFESYGFLTAPPVFDASFKISKASVGGGKDRQNIWDLDNQSEDRHSLPREGELSGIIVRHSDHNEASNIHGPWLASTESKSNPLLAAGPLLPLGIRRDGANAISLHDPESLSQNARVGYQTSFANTDHQQPARIPPDLDALFDELSSMDGVEGSDNNLQFLQNLGFSSSSMASGLLPGYDDLDTFLFS